MAMLKKSPIDDAIDVSIDSHFFIDNTSINGVGHFELRNKQTQETLTLQSINIPTVIENYDIGEFSALLLPGIEYEWDVFSRAFGDGGVFSFITFAPLISSRYGISREVYAPVKEESLKITATVIPQEINSGKSEIFFNWNLIGRDEKGYDIEYVSGGSGKVNEQRLISGTSTFSVLNLASKKSQFKLLKYDIDTNVVDCLSNEILIPNRTPPAVPVFNDSMILWLDQGPNSGNSQVVKIQINIPIDSTYVQVIAVSGVGVKSSGKISTNGYYIDTRVGDDQIVSYKLRSIDINGNYADSESINLAIAKRSVLTPPSIG